MVGADGAGVNEVVEIRRLINSGGVEISRMCALRVFNFYPYLHSRDDNIFMPQATYQILQVPYAPELPNFTTFELICLFKVFIILYTGSFG